MPYDLCPRSGVKMPRRMRPNVEGLENKSLLSGLAVSLTTSQPSYDAGQPISMTFTETNTGASPVSIGVGPSIDGFFVTHDGQTVWASNEGANPMYIVKETIQPGQSFTLTATWDGIQDEGSPVSRDGTFVVSNQLAPEGPSATFTILNNSTVTPPPPPPPPPPPTPVVPPVIVSPSPTPPTPTPTPVDPPTPLPAPAIPISTQPASPLLATLTTNHSTYHRGQAVRLSLLEKNTGPQAVSVAGGRHIVDLQVTRGATVVWRTPASMVSASAARTLNAGQSRTMSFAWNGKSNVPRVKIAPGMYTVTAMVDGISMSESIQIG